MAIEYGDGKAGQFAKAQSHKDFDRIWIRIVVSFTTIAGTIGGFAGFILALKAMRADAVLAHHRDVLLLTAVGAEIVVGILFFQCRHYLRRPMEKIMRERAYRLRGGQTEALVALYLKTLDDEWHVFHNVVLSAKGGDIDHIVIGPKGVFCLSTKSTTGTYSMTDDGAFLWNGKPCPDMQEARRLALKLKDWLGFKLNELTSPLDPPWVQPVLVAPFVYFDETLRQDAVCFTDDMGLIRCIERCETNVKSAVVRASVDALCQITNRQVKHRETM